MSHSLVPKSGWLKQAVFALTLSSGLLIVAPAAAQNSSSALSSASPADHAAATVKPSDADHRLIKPGDRTCLRQTGSLIPPKKGDCLPVAGRSYSRDELRNTGAIDNARALQMLDPSISLGH